jgi:hypothetical protein
MNDKGGSRHLRHLFRYVERARLPDLPVSLGGRHRRRHERAVALCLLIIGPAQQLVGRRAQEESIVGLAKCAQAL